MANERYVGPLWSSTYYYPPLGTVTTTGPEEIREEYNEGWPCGPDQLGILNATIGVLYPDEDEDTNQRTTIVSVLAVTGEQAGVVAAAIHKRIVEQGDLQSWWLGAKHVHDFLGPEDFSESPAGRTYCVDPNCSAFLAG